MSGTIELVMAPAGAGKTSALLDLYAVSLRQARSSLQLGTALWLAPNLRETFQICQRLSQRLGGVLVEPQVLTFEDFAKQIRERTAQPVTPLAPGQQRTLLRNIVRRLRDAAELRHFGPIADSAGFLDLVQSFIAELKRAETWPDDLARACAERGASARDRELTRIYSEYQRVLLEQRWFDAEGRFWWARESLRNEAWDAFPCLELVVVDGFDDFNQIQYEILGHLADRAGRLVLSLPGEPGERRADLFAKSRRVPEQLARHARVVDWQGPGATLSVEQRPAGLRKISSDLFGNVRETPRQSSAEGLEIVAVAGQRGEVQWLAAKIKQLLLAGEDPGDIVVVFRDVADYADLSNQVCPAAGLPLDLDWSPSLQEAPVLRALLKLLALELADWPYDQLQDVLRSPFLPFLAAPSGEWKISATLGALRRLQVGEDRVRILDSLAREEEQGAREGFRRQASVALEVLRSLDDRLQPLRQRHTLKQWGIELRKLGSQLQFLRWGGDDSPDVEHWKRLLESIFAAAKVDTLPGEASRILDLTAFVRELTDLLRRQEQSPPSALAGGIRVLSASEVRNLDVPWLFFAGLNEQSFPRRRSDDCLYGEVERRQLNDSGLQLGHQSLRTQEEMLLFYRVCTRATRGLTLLYPAVSPEGAPLTCSPYVTAVRDLFEPQAALQGLESELDPVPSLQRILGASDLRVRGMYEALEGKPGLLALAADHPLTRKSIVRTLPAADLKTLRFHTPGFTPADGQLEQPANQRWLAKLFPQSRQFSATHLEQYGGCPFRFFLERVLRIEPLPSIEFATDHGERGSLIHSAFAELHQRDLTDGEPPANPPQGEELARRFAEIIRRRITEQPQADRLREALAEVEIELLTEWGEEYGRQWDKHIERCRATFSEVPQPVLFEKAFGESVDPEGPSSGGAAADVVRLGKPGCEVRLGGRIDRIDRWRLGDQSVVFVVAYKSGSKKSLSRADVALGTNLQLPLYVLAVQEHGLAGEGAQVAQAAFWYLKEGGFTPGLKAPRQRGSKTGLDLLGAEEWNEAREDLGRVVPRIVDGMRQGEFPVYNRDDHCMTYCPHRLVCRVAQVRALDDRLQKTFVLLPDSDAVAPP
ncbi:MAG: PD-(D/E)XK nuclease family protein [Planctomycetaceae bacterium]